MTNQKSEASLTPHYQVTLPVDISAINYGGHLAHDRLITLMHEARLRFLKSLGQSEVDFYGTGLISKSLQVDYHKEIFWGAQLNFAIRASVLRGAGFTLNYFITDEADDLVSEAAITFICFDYQKRKVSRLSKDFAKALENTLENSQVSAD